MANADGVIIQSVAKALDILSCFANHKSELGISDIAEGMEINKSTVYGLVNTLVAKGYLEQNPETKRYRLGIKLFELGNLVGRRMDLFTDAMPFCEELSNRFNASVHLAARYGDEVVYIGKVDNPDAYIVYSQVGKRVPMHCTGVGKAILAFLDPVEQAKFIAGDLQRFTEFTITSPAQLRDNLAMSRRRGYAIDDEEIQLGLRCIAAPIFNHENEPLAALSLSGPVAKFPLNELDAIAEQVLLYAGKISRRMGYNAAAVVG